MNTYLTQSKLAFIKEARDEFQRIYGIDHTSFTRKIYFYFFTYNNRKYIYKPALNFVYTNADTFTTERDPFFCYLNKQIKPIDIIEFLESYQGSLLPTLLESNDSFLVYEYFVGNPIDSITSLEFHYLKSQHNLLTLTPFYNSMTYNLVRNESAIKLIDFKHFELKDSKPFFIYLFNEDNRVNTLYIEKDTNIESIMEHLAIDYPVKDATIIEY